MGRDHPRAAGGMGLCKSKLPEVGRPLRPQEKDILKSPLIIFVMGGPGCGKGTQCKNMATKYGFRHVGLGQLLRQEARRSTQRGRKIYDIMLQGLLVPTGIILDLISSTMLSHPESRGFLIDGFPRGLKQAKEFERLVSDPRVCKRAVRREAAPPLPALNGDQKEWAGPQTSSSCLIAPWIQWSGECCTGAGWSTGQMTVSRPSASAWRPTTCCVSQS
ncbi:adenylate kinase isoenzyme 1-like isoform X4 [Canis lupus baileyi]|uniref:adenylate kinase isoenzyme 1-like isoform X4 n=1 Tax=Canis lupus familiaris TaxID=9615 RepID=UPI000BAA27A7|nr:adenylate kinase isoenzyme 1-like isoform X4 [Canis lupus familiaris]XP_022262856.1 adenylate kinase isoenzyme 1-like isoform X4 [Canis lupus familiaris]XP_025313011.1 adenylate kinase isoenzyme 1 isoform X4 [Canis lupus dingo]XP_025313012.1 adenylate kinase isoenzyme 1 isoform X4 [Canis lupus dingo]XP_038284831.1 adenylate kinase isoenzyme 1-like isoform X4 [Canis lupus familiaris]XP_038284832.1 adenylate kinase isoenzyme 1-like isoform X4 [Canis lupus familiaris]XP_038423509.1 adenylate |eukprot:XP_022262855.1 adenylate kinase isoenzyme 1-like isoform X4 [Canis lupus familiaris]